MWEAYRHDPRPMSGYIRPWRAELERGDQLGHPREMVVNVAVEGDRLPGDLVELGARDGWLDRSVRALPGSEGLALAAVMPLIMCIVRRLLLPEPVVWPHWMHNASLKVKNTPRLRALRVATPPPLQGATPAARQSRFRGVSGRRVALPPAK